MILEEIMIVGIEIGIETETIDPTEVQGTTMTAVTGTERYYNFLINFMLKNIYKLLVIFRKKKMDCFMT